MPILYERKFISKQLFPFKYISHLSHELILKVLLFSDSIQTSVWMEAVAKRVQKVNHRNTRAVSEKFYTYSYNSIWIFNLKSISSQVKDWNIMIR